MKKWSNWHISFSFLILTSSCNFAVTDDKQKIEDLNTEIVLLNQRIDSLISALQHQHTAILIPNTKKKSISSNKKKLNENKIQPLVNKPVETIPIPTNNNKTTSSTSNYTPTKKSQPTYSSRCQAITKKGTQCKRSSSSGSSYCWQH